MGTSPLYYLAVAIYMLPAHPAVIGSAAMLWGYLGSWLKGLARYDDFEFRRFLRSYQHACLRMVESTPNAHPFGMPSTRPPGPDVPPNGWTIASIHAPPSGAYMVMPCWQRR
jgi:hypothetical protein